MTRSENFNRPQIFLINWFICIGFLLYFWNLTYADSSTKWKEWQEYTKEEKDTLKARWTEEKVKEVLKALKEGIPLPVKTLRLSKEELEEIPANYRENAVRQSYDLRAIPLSGDTLISVNLSFAHLEGAVLEEANLRSAKLMGANLSGAYLSGASLIRANLKIANLQGADLTNVDLQKANLEEANLTNAKLFKANLQGAQVSKAILQGVDLIGANMQGATLIGANLKQASLRGANLTKANLAVANLQEAELVTTILQNASLVQAKLDGADFRQANLEGADVYYAIFANTLIEVEQLEKTINYLYIIEGRDPSSREWNRVEAAEILHRAAKNFFKKEGMIEMADEYHYWENEVMTLKSPWPERILRILFLKWTYGYGARPIWILRSCILIVVIFALIYFFLTLPRKTKSGIYLVRSENKVRSNILLPFGKGRLIVDCVYFSLLSFATFGYGALKPRQWLEFFRLEPVEYTPIGWARIFVGIEATLGIYLFALLASVLLG